MTLAASRLVYVMGPSGAGKDSIIQYARRKLNATERILFAHRYVTRPAGADIENYIALTPAEFAQRKEHGLFVFDWDAYGVSYGVGREIELWQDAAFIVVVDGSRAHFVRHADSLRGAWPVLITATAEALRNRLRGRGRESPQQIEERLERAAMALPDLPVSTIDNTGPLPEAGERFAELLTALARKR